jgi:hypothetical protein
MGEVVPDGVRAMECFLCVCYGLALLIWFMSRDMDFPHVIERYPLLRFPFGVGVGVEGGDRACPWFLY